MSSSSTSLRSSSYSSSNKVGRSWSPSYGKPDSVEEFASWLDSKLKEEIDNFRFPEEDEDDSDNSPQTNV